MPWLAPACLQVDDSGDQPVDVLGGVEDEGDVVGPAWSGDLAVAVVPVLGVDGFPPLADLGESIFGGPPSRGARSAMPIALECYTMPPSGPTGGGASWG
jgi:hypothetical protein